MPLLKHYKAIRVIEKRIEELQKEIALTNKIINHPEMQSDYHFATADKENFLQEITELKSTIQILVK